jgi:O-antigen ligase
VLRQALDGLEESPIAGYGTFGSGMLYQPHNQWIGVWLDSGILGITLFGGGLILLLRHIRRSDPEHMVIWMAMAATTPFSHNLLTEAGFLLCWVVAASSAPPVFILRPTRHRRRAGEEENRVSFYRRGFSEEAQEGRHD